MGPSRLQSLSLQLADKLAQLVANNEMARISDPTNLEIPKIETISLVIVTTVTMLESLVMVANSTLIVVTERSLLTRIILTKNQLVVSPVGSSCLDIFCVSNPNLRRLKKIC